MLITLAPAKLNLTLEVLNKRSDGYHEIRSLVQTISLYDRLSFEIASEISFECTEQVLRTQDNLVLRAARLLQTTCNYKRGARIKLEKKIPWSAGLGGGSSDAAATLLTLNKIWNLRLQTSELMKLAAQLGSDVPFFIHKGTAVIEGKGEKVISLPLGSSPSWFVLLLPPLSSFIDKTKQAYARLKKQHFTTGQFTTEAAETWTKNGEINPALLFNVFNSVAFDIFPELDVYWKHFEQAAATNIYLAGSGPTLFTLAANRNSARAVHQQLGNQGITSYIVSTTLE